MPLQFRPDSSWTLFLDRDGVINVRKMDEYVLKNEEFIFIEGVPDAIALLTSLFGRSFVVTNQQGIGKGLMTAEDLQHIHDKMMAEISKAGGKIDRIYYCDALNESGSFMRKPLPGMGRLAKKDFPEIEFKKSVMVGDTISDMKFGRNLKMITVYVGNDKKAVREYHKIIDLAFSSLVEFAEFIKGLPLPESHSQ